MNSEEMESQAFDNNSVMHTKIAASGSKTLKLGKLNIRFGYLCQGGYRSEEPVHKNKDWYSAVKEFGVDKTDAFFAVFDGHGKEGDNCSHYAAEEIPRRLNRELKRAQKNTKGDLREEQIYEACSESYLGCNRALQNNRKFNVDFAGTTAISAYIQSKMRRVFISNVGDSRAVLGRDGTAIPLSRDQTLYRGVERQRIRQSGARILSLDQIDGISPITMGRENVTPGTEEMFDYRDLIEGEEEESGLRVWHEERDMPGSAFSRSIGDSEAEALGVIADPEMVMLNLSEENDVIVLASDGVFEFLTNQSVIDICMKCKDEGPLKACEEVISRSRKFWEKYENQIDDMTMICIFIESSSYAGQRRNRTYK